MTNPESEVITVTADATGLLTAFKDPRNNEYTYTYTSEGRLFSDEDPAGGSQTLTRETGLNRLTVTRETGLTRETVYETSMFADGAVERKITDPAGLITKRTVGTHGVNTQELPSGLAVTESLGVETRFEMLAPLVRMRRERLPSGLARTVEVTRPYAASSFNPPTVSAGPWKEHVLVNGSDLIQTEFDLASKRLTITSPESRLTKVTVDAAGRPLALHVPGLDTLRREYDTRGRLKVLKQGSRIWVMDYDAKGRLAFVRDTLGRMTQFGYDDADRLTQQSLPGGRQLAFGYDASSNLKSVTTPRSDVHEFDYTTVDLTDRYRPPAAGMTNYLTQYDHNVDRQLRTVLRPDSANVTLTYGASSGRLDRISTPRGDVDLGYDMSGRLATLSSPDNVSLTHQFDGPLVTSETYGGAMSGSVSFTPDRHFRVSSQRVNGGNEVVYAYDGDGLVTSAGALTISRRADNGLISGTSLASSNLTTSESYNVYGEPEFSVALSGTDTLWRAWYGRDVLGRITQIHENVEGAWKSWIFAYSDTGFLSRVTLDGTVTERYAYDANGNRTRFDGPAAGDSGYYDAQDRLTQYGSTTYAYTAAGELASSTTGGNTTQYTYDPLGNLIKVQFQNGDSINYLIDGRNRRVGRKFNGTLTARWLYQDQLEPVAEIDTSGAIVARYVYGTRSHVPDYVVKGGTTYRIISDHLGSVRLVVNASTGAVAQRMDYAGFGRVTLDTSPGFQAFGYAGGLYDTLTALVRFGARDYDAEVGRWTSKDPTGIRARVYNVYSYADGNPIEYVDHTGLVPVNYYDSAREALLLQPVEDLAFVLTLRSNELTRRGNRHAGVSEILASRYGANVSRTLGLVSEIPRFIQALLQGGPEKDEALDIGRDILENERGIARAESKRRLCRTPMQDGAQ